MSAKNLRQRRFQLLSKPVIICVLSGLALNWTLWLTSPQVYADNFLVDCTNGAGDVTGLINAISTANTNGQNSNTINLTAYCTYTLTTVNNGSVDGANGLPLIQNSLIINGNGATLTRSTVNGTPNFRFFYVYLTNVNLNINNLTVSNARDSSTGAGGGAIFYYSGGTLLLNNSIFSANSTVYGPGGVVNNYYGKLIIKNSTFSANLSGDDGGVILNADGSTLTIDSSTFANNTANGSGGVIKNDSRVGVSVINSTFAANSATGGGAIFNNLGNLSVINVTFAANSAFVGGTIGSDNLAVTTVRTSIFVPGANGTNCISQNGATFTAGGSHNIEVNPALGPATCGAGNSVTNLNPLGANTLANNGGPTQTIALPAGSTAGASGLNCPATDQRGIARPSNHCSSGAFQPILPPLIQKTFEQPAILLNSTTGLSFTISNPNSRATLNGLSFTDNFPGGLVVATPNGLNNACGGTVSANAGSNTVSLTNGTLAAGTSCTISLNVQGSSLGSKINQTGLISSIEGGQGQSSNPATTRVGNGVTVTQPSDDGTGTTPGSLSAALKAFSADQIIVFNLQGGGTIITVTGPLPIVPVGAAIKGSCNGAGPGITIKGNNLVGQIDGLVLMGNAGVFGIKVQGFPGRQIAASVTASQAKNSLKCVVTSKT